MGSGALDVLTAHRHPQPLEHKHARADNAPLQISEPPPAKKRQVPG